MTSYEKATLIHEIKLLLDRINSSPAWVVAAAYDKFDWDEVLAEPVRVHNVAGWLIQKEKYPATE